MSHLLIFVLTYCWHFLQLTECLNTLNVGNSFLYNPPVTNSQPFNPFEKVIPYPTCQSAGCSYHKKIIENNDVNDCLNGYICKGCKETHIKNQSICFYSSIEGYESLYEALLEDTSDTPYDHFNIPIEIHKPKINPAKGHLTKGETNETGAEEVTGKEKGNIIQSKKENTNKKRKAKEEENEEIEVDETDENEDTEEEEEEDEDESEKKGKNGKKKKKPSRAESFLEKKNRIRQKRKWKRKSMQYNIKTDPNNEEYNLSDQKEQFSFFEKKLEKKKKIYRTLKMSINAYEDFLKSKLRDCEVKPDGIVNIYIKMILQIVENKDEVFNDPSRQSIFKRQNGIENQYPPRKRSNGDEEEDVNVEGEGEEEEENDEDNESYGNYLNNKNKKYSTPSKTYVEKTNSQSLNSEDEQENENSNYNQQTHDAISENNNRKTTTTTTTNHSSNNLSYINNGYPHDSYNHSSGSGTGTTTGTDGTAKLYGTSFVPSYNYYSNGYPSNANAYPNGHVNNYSSVNSTPYYSGYGYIELGNSKKTNVKNDAHKEQHSFLQLRDQYENEDSMEQYYKKKPGFFKSLFQKVRRKKGNSEDEGEADDMDEDSGKKKKKFFSRNKKKKKTQHKSNGGFHDAEEDEEGGGGGDDDDDEYEGNTRSNKPTSSNNKKETKKKKILGKIKKKILPDKQTLHIEAFFNSIIVNSCKDSLKWKGKMFGKNSLIEMTLKVPVQMNYINQNPLHFLRSGYEIVISCQNCAHVFFNSCIQVYCPRNTNATEDISQFNTTATAPLVYSNVPLTYNMEYGPWSSYFMYNDYFNKSEMNFIKLVTLILIISSIFVTL